MTLNEISHLNPRSLILLRLCLNVAEKVIVGINRIPNYKPCFWSFSSKPEHVFTSCKMNDQTVMYAAIIAEENSLAAAMSWKPGLLRRDKMRRITRYLVLFLICHTNLACQPEHEDSLILRHASTHIKHTFVLCRQP